MDIYKDFDLFCNGISMQMFPMKYLQFRINTINILIFIRKHIHCNRIINDNANIK